MYLAELKPLTWDVESVRTYIFTRSTSHPLCWRISCLLQAVALSQLPQQHLQALRSRGLQAAQLTSLVDWFQGSVRQGDDDRRVTPEESQQVLAASAPHH